MRGQQDVEARTAAASWRCPLAAVQERMDRNASLQAHHERIRSGAAADWQMTQEELWKHVADAHVGAVEAGLRAKLLVSARSVDGNRWTLLHVAVKVRARLNSPRLPRDIVAIASSLLRLVQSQRNEFNGPYTVGFGHVETHGECLVATGTRLHRDPAPRRRREQTSVRRMASFRYVYLWARRCRPRSWRRRAVPRHATRRHGQPCLRRSRSHHDVGPCRYVIRCGAEALVRREDCVGGAAVALTLTPFSVQVLRTFGGLP